MAQSHEERFADLSTKKVWSIFLGLGGFVIFIGNLTGADGPPNATLGAIGLGCLIVGAIWFWDIRQKLNELAMRGRE